MARNALAEPVPENLLNVNCRRVKTLLSAYLDSELTGFEMLDIRDHLSRCGECADERDSLRSVKMLLSSLPQRDPRPEFATQVCSHVQFVNLPLHERIRAMLAMSAQMPPFNTRRVASAAMLSVLGVFLASGSFDHTVNEQQAGLGYAGFVTSFPHRVRQVAVSYRPYGASSAFARPDQILDPRRHPADLSFNETPLVQLTSLSPTPRYNSLSFASFQSPSGESVSSR